MFQVLWTSLAYTTVLFAIGRSLFDQMIAAEGDRAAEEATREFPEYIQEVMKRRVQRGKP